MTSLLSSLVQLSTTNLPTETQCYTLDSRSVDIGSNIMEEEEEPSIVEYRGEHERYRCGYCGSKDTNNSHG